MTAVATTAVAASPIAAIRIADPKTRREPCGDILRPVPGSLDDVHPHGRP